VAIRKVKAGLVKTVTINEFVGEDGNIFFDIDDGSIRLSDGVTPGGAVIVGNSSGSATSFTQLQDTPSSFTGNATGYLKVNASGTAIEFVQETGFSGDYDDLANKPDVLDPTAIDQSLVPDADEAYDLGTANLKWRDLYLSGNTLFLGTAAIRNVEGTIELPGNAKINGRKIPIFADDLADLLEVVDGGRADTW
jgi:hypothetical protein